MDCPHCKKEIPAEMEETFTRNEIANSVKAFIDYGEESFNPTKKRKLHGHQGYFSGSGFAARAMRYLYRQLNKSDFRL